MLRGESKRDVNVRGACVHVLGDALSAAVVVIADMVVATAGSYIADPIVSIIHLFGSPGPQSVLGGRQEVLFVVL